MLKKQLAHFMKAQLPPVSPTEQVALNGLSLDDLPWANKTLHGTMDWDGLYGLGKSGLSAEEQAFLAGPTQKLCLMIDDWVVRQKNDLTEDVWDFMRENKFFGMVISKEEGGLGFSAQGHSAVVKMIGTHSPAAAVAVMVPNSLGPGELLHRYGTKEQKEKYLPGLAAGKLIPCFALTGPNNGSDASEPETTGELFEKEDGSLGIRIDGSKRYITLAPGADLVGVAFSLKISPEMEQKLNDRGMGDLVERVKSIPTTVALMERGAPGMTIGKRHDPGVAFLNGPIEFDNAVISTDQIIGGLEQAGNGWKMLMECLGVGRAISLPTISNAGSQRATMTTSAYSAVRTQFGLPIAKFDGVSTVIGEMAGLTYLTEAARVVGAQMVDAGQNTTILSAMTKSGATEMNRTVINHAMDIQAGKAIQDGPSNVIRSFYDAIPVGITVEGANLMTKNLIIFGQGATMSHPHIRNIMEKAANNDADGLWNEVKGVVSDFSGNIGKSILLSLTDGRGMGVENSYVISPEVKRLHQKTDRLCAAFSVAADCSMYHLTGSLKRKEDISRRLGDAWTMLNFAAMALKHWDDQGRKKDDLPLVNWGVQYSLHHAEKALDDLMVNYPNKAIATFMRVATGMPFGGRYRMPSDKLTHAVADLVTAPSPSRDRLLAGTFVSRQPGNPVRKLEDTFKLCASREMQQTERRARKGEELTPAETKDLATMRGMRDQVVAVDSHIDQKYYNPS